MKSSYLCALVALSLCMQAEGQAQVTFDWATVGNPGNDGETPAPSSPATSVNGEYGSVDYIYNISKHEVTNAQYVEFLNAIAKTDTNSIFNTSIQDLDREITRSGSPGSYTYAVKPAAVGQGPNGSDYSYHDKPAGNISFYNAMRFVNWLANDQPTGQQDDSTTEAGTYRISDGDSVRRSAGSTYVIPTEDEWYKAAYYDPDSDIYYDYPTSTDVPPNNKWPADDTGNSASYAVGGDGRVDIVRNIEFAKTDVGAYALSPSPYGTFDQGGNVDEWLDSPLTFAGSELNGSRMIRGGNAAFFRDNLSSGSNGSNFLSREYPFLGFRVALIPEPSTFLLGTLASIGLLLHSRKHR